MDSIVKIGLKRIIGIYTLYDSTHCTVITFNGLRKSRSFIMSANEFYPVSQELIVLNPVYTFGWIEVVQRLLDEAKVGSSSAESELCNRIGQLHRCQPERIPSPCKALVVEAIRFLRSQGRVVDFTQFDPRLWISRRGGSPRW